MKLSLTTINLIFDIFSKSQVGGSLEDDIRDYEALLALARRSGFRAVEITAFEIQFMGVEKVREILKRCGLEVSSYIHLGQFVDLDPAVCSLAIADGKAAIDIGLSLGTKVVMMVPIAHERIAECGRQAMSDQMVDTWRPIVEHATRKSIHVVVEDYPELRIPLCTTEELRYVMDRVPNLKMVYDSGNCLLVGEDPVKVYDTFADRIVHIHLKDMRIVKDGERPLVDTALDGTKMAGALHGKGLVDLETLMAHIRKNGYEGYLTAEYNAIGEEKLHQEENFRGIVAYLKAINQE